MQKRILLVEDEDFIRDLYKRQLTLADFLVDAAVTGKEGLALIEKNTYDLLLLDIMLPDINGVELLKRARQGTLNKATTTIFLTNLGQDDVIKHGFEEGAAGYLIKAQYTPDQIVAEVKNIFAQNQPTAPGAPVPPETPPTQQ